MSAHFMKNPYPIHYTRDEYRNEYLVSPDWKKKRLIVLERDEVCRICDVTVSHDVHHITYDRIPFENLETDLIGICRPCHNKIHSWHLLTKCRSVKKIRSLISMMKTKFEIDDLFISKMNGLPINSKKKMSSLFKKNVHSFESLRGVMVTFRTYLDIRDLIKTARKKFKSKKLGFKINKPQNSFLGHGGWSRKIL